MPAHPPSAAEQAAQRQRVRQGVMLAFAASAAFSMKAIFTKLAYRYPGVDATVLLMYRMLFAFPFFIWLAHQSGRGQAPLPRKDLGLIVVMGVLGYYVASYADFLGLQYITASLERLILYLYPTLVVGLGWLFFRQRVSRAQIISMLISYLGVWLVFAQEVHVAGSHVALGSALVFLSGLSYAAYLVVSGRVVHRIGAMRLSGWATSVACIICIGQFFVLKPWSAALVPWPVIGLSLLNGIVCTAIPVTLTMAAIARIGSARVAQIGMVGPMATIGMGIVLLGEPFNLWLVLGTALVLLGIYVANQSGTSSANIK